MLLLETIIDSFSLWQGAFISDPRIFSHSLILFTISFNSIGLEIIRHASDKGFKIFLDLKLHDIPNTVKKSISGLVALPIQMLTIHISGGVEMMKAAMEAVEGTNIKIFGVTALTSLSNDETNRIFQRNTSEQVMTMID